MNNLYEYVCIFLMATVTYIIRVLPLLVFRKPIKNRFFRSFLYYSPFITLSVMTFPAVLNCTQSFTTSAIGFASAVIMSFFGVNFVVTTFGTCFVVFLAQLIFHV